MAEYSRTPTRRSSVRFTPDVIPDLEQPKRIEGGEVELILEDHEEQKSKKESATFVKTEKGWNAISRRGEVAITAKESKVINVLKQMVKQVVVYESSMKSTKG